MADEAAQAARALAKLGAAKGGRTRAERLDPEARSSIAREAAEARWGTTFPYATHEGELRIGETTISCAVLENGKRVLTQRSFMQAVGRSVTAKSARGVSSLAEGLPPFLAAENLVPFVSDELRQAATPIVFRNMRGTRSYGYDALLLPMVCEVYLAANDAKKIRESQKKILDRCSLLIRGFARVGITALVDEASGYQEDRTKDELQRILAKYIAPELQPWTRMFPNDFFKEVYRIHGWPYRPDSTARTPEVGRIINKYVYGKLPPGVLPELQRINPRTEKGWRRHKHHQFLTADTGNVHLDKQIVAVMTLMRISDTKHDFDQYFNKMFGAPVQQRLPLVIRVNDDQGQASA